MTTFSDNFNRANGPLGANWSSPNNWVSIVSNQAAASSASYARCLAFSEAGAQTASATLAVSGAYYNQNYVAVKCNDAMTAGYSAFLTGTPGAHYATIYRINGGLNLAVTYVPVNFGSSAKYTLTYNNGFLTFYVNDVPYAWASDSLNDTNLYAAFGLRSASFTCTLFEAAGVSTALFHVYPTAALTDGPPIQLQLVGSGTAWTPGSPGSPTFSASAGVLADQVVTSAGTATVTFTPPNTDQTVTITDPSTGLTDTIDVNTTTPPGGGGGGAACPFDDEFIAIANATHPTPDAGHLLTDYDVVHLSPTLGIADSLDYLIMLVRNLYVSAPPWPPDSLSPDPTLSYIFQVLNGANTPAAGPFTPSTTQPVKLDTEQIKLAVDDMYQAGYTLPMVINTLRGAGAYDLTTITDLIAALPDSHGLEILARLTEIQGPGVDTLYSLAEKLASIQGPGLHSIDTVLEELAYKPSNAALAAAVATIEGSIGAVALEIVALGTAEAADAASSAAAAGSAAAALAWLTLNGPDILSLLDQIKDLLGGATPMVYHPPVWPGAAHVVYGAAQDLNAGLVVPGPMHGVRIHITSVDPGTGFYDYDVDRCYRNIGAVSFVSDVGDHEHWQPLGFTSCVYVPKTMTQAASAKLHLGHGPQGTITPWSYAT